MKAEKIQIVKVPDFDPSTIRADQTKKKKSKKRGEIMKNPKCSIHGEEMEQIGESKRGIPEWICPKGCKIEMGRGQLKMVKPEKGYGFILVEGGDDIFFHVSEMEGSWPPELGDLLEFKIGLNQVSGELQAVGIRNLSENGRNQTNG